jgi:hypothetical protein
MAKSKQKRKIEAKTRLGALMKMGGIGIPHLDETIRGFYQNLI